MITVYTQDNCQYCDFIKSKLSTWGYTYQEVNIHKDSDTLAWMKSRGHRTVPQIYISEYNVNDGIDTVDLRKEHFKIFDDLRIDEIDEVAEVIESKQYSTAVVRHRNGEISLYEREFASLGGNAEWSLLVPKLSDREIEYCRNKGIYIDENVQQNESV